MKKLKISIFRVLFTLAVFLCFGSDAYSSCSFQATTIEIVNSDFGSAESLNSHFNSPENDQIDNFSTVSSFVQLKSPLFVPGNLLFPELSFPIWLPPQNS